MPLSPSMLDCPENCKVRGRTYSDHINQGIRKKINYEFLLQDISRDLLMKLDIPLKEC